MSRKLKLRKDFGWEAKRTRKFPRKYPQVAIKPISRQKYPVFHALANNRLMDVTQLALTWVGWPKGEKVALICVQIWSRPKWAQVNANQRTWTQVFNLRQLASPFGQGLRQVKSFCKDVLPRGGLPATLFCATCCTSWNLLLEWMAKRVQHEVYSNVAIYYLKMLRSFARGLHMLWAITFSRKLTFFSYSHRLLTGSQLAWNKSRVKCLYIPRTKQLNN